MMRRFHQIGWMLAIAALLIGARSSWVSAAQPASSPLVGEWILVSSDRPGNPSGIGIRRKTFTQSTWSMIQKDPVTGIVAFEHSGEYKLEGTAYTEKVTRAGPSTANLVGQTFKCQVTVTGDTYTQVGPWNETWRRVLPAR